MVLLICSYLINPILLTLYYVPYLIDLIIWLFSKYFSYRLAFRIYLIQFNLYPLILLTLSYYLFLMSLSYDFLITLAYTVPTLSYVHFPIDLILCAVSYNSTWIMWDYLMYIFLLTSSYWPHLMNIFLLRGIILCTFSYWPHLIHRILCKFSYYVGLSYVHFLF